MGKNAKQPPAGCLIVFGLPFLGAGLGVLIYAALCWKTYFESSSWERVPARIESVELKSHSDSDGTTYSVECRYSYEFEGRGYAGTRVGIMGGSSSNYKTHRRRCGVLKKHMDAEEPFLAFVDPDDPQRALLFREPEVWMFVLLPFGLVFAGVGAGIMGGGVVAKRRRRRKELALDMGERPWFVRDDWREMRVRASTVKDLTVAWGVGIGLPLFVSIFLIVADEAPFFAKAIIWLFAAIAVLAFLGAIVSTLRALLHGVPVLALTELPIVPGRRMVAAVQTRRPLDADRAELILSCTERSSGKNATLQELHKEKLAVDAASMRTDADRTLLPVVIDIPEGLPGRRDDESPFITWSLEVKAPTFPVALEAKFDLPVFQTDESEIQKRQP